jgi:hypothetical protein
MEEATILAFGLTKGLAIEILVAALGGLSVYGLLRLKCTVFKCRRALFYAILCIPCLALVFGGVFAATYTYPPLELIAVLAAAGLVISSVLGAIFYICCMAGKVLRTARTPLSRPRPRI